MPKRTNSTKSKIVEAAWQLFYEQGYDDTTIDEIIEKSCTSKGSFYHYFNGKEELLGSLPTLFDDKYESLAELIAPESNRFDILMWLNKELFRMIENSVSIDMLAGMYSAQLTPKSDKQLLDHSRFYFRLLRKIIMEGIERGEINGNESVNDIIKVYAMCERSFLYDWCICNGEYSLSEYSAKMLPRFMSFYRK
ncbi:MAG: TetR/AcrR family transcriptional regulator [Clostridia bacterium]|nr:TetR/AcrR family transcriptional regulator [Clostridia bacterium]